MAVSGNLEWEGFDTDLNTDNSRQDGELFNGSDEVESHIGALDLQGVEKEVDAISDSESVDSWSAELGILEEQTGKRKAKRGKTAKGKGAKAKASKSKGKEKQSEKQTPKESEYERTRKENIARNEALLKELGLDHASTDLGFARPKPKPRGRMTKDKPITPALPERRSTRTG
jgi:uncharacterized protein YaiL (DUF2058 family)